MGLPRLRSCCCMLDLKTGNVVLGCINAMLSLSLLCVLSARAAELGALADAEDARQAARRAALKAELLAEAERKAELTAGADVALEGPAERALDAETRAALLGAYVMCVMLVFMFLAKLGFDVLFVYAVVKERAGVIKAYFVMWVVFFLLSVSTFFLSGDAGPTLTASELFYDGLNVYAILLSYSFYRQLNEREELIELPYQASYQAHGNTYTQQITGAGPTYTQEITGTGLKDIKALEQRKSPDP